MNRFVHSLLALAAITALQACSRSQPDDASSASAQAAAQDNPPAAAPKGPDAAALRKLEAVRADIAARAQGQYGEHCHFTLGKGDPDLSKGLPLSFGPDGVLRWGDKTLDLVKTPGMKLSAMRHDKGQSGIFNFESVQEATGARLHIGGINQNSSVPGASLTDSSKAPDDSSQAQGFICMGTKPPALFTQSLWSIAEKHMPVAKTTLSCAPLGRMDFQDVSFSFQDGQITAGAQVFQASDAEQAEQLFVDPHSDKALSYSVTKADQTSVTLTLSAGGKLSFAQLSTPQGQLLACSPKR